MQYRVRNNILVQEAGNEYLALDGVSGACHVLNETAGWLLLLATNFVTVDDAIQSATKQYDVQDPSVLAADVAAAVRALADKGLVEVAE